MKKTIILCCALLLLLGLLFAGCGVPDETEEMAEEPSDEEIVVDEEEPVEENAVDDEEDIMFETGQWITPETYGDFVATFQEIQYSVGEVGGQKTTVQYVHLGIENVDGVQTDKVELSVAGEGSFTIWSDSEGEIQRLLVDGEEIPVDMARMFADSILTMALLPFQQATAYSVNQLFTTGVSGLDETYLGSETETFGDLSATVHRIRISVEPPAVPEGQEAEAILGIADFGDFQMVTSWEVEEMADDSFRGEFTIDKVALR